jgi:hypothetical protein
MVISNNSFLIFNYINLSYKDSKYFQLKIIIYTYVKINYNQ